MPNRQPRQSRDRFATLLMAALLGLGFYLPTSTGENISVHWYLASAAALFGLLVLLLLRRRGIVSVASVVNAAAVNAILLVCTLLSPLKEFAYGGWIPIFLLSVLICVCVRDVGLTATVRALFDVTNALNIALAALLVADVSAVRQFFLTHYAFGYDDLLPYMLDEHKPVIMFGSHSVAGFFFYLLFYMTFQTFVVTRSKLNLVYSLCYLALLASLASFTSAVFAPLAVAQIILHFQWHKSFVAGMAATILLLAAAVALPQTSFFDGVKTDFLDVTSRADNGLMGRYSASGGLVGNLDYITEHPFQPIGLGLSYSLWYADSGPVEYFLKGSFPLLLTIYTGVFVFFYRNLLDRKRAMFLFLVFLAFECGYSNLQYLRTQFFLPFLMVYLNGLDRANLPQELQHV